MALTRNRPDYVTKELIRGVIYELVDRVLNAVVGRSLMKHREKSLARANPVAFRTELAVKSEKV